MILDIRGTHGSGKTWLIHQLLKTGSQPITGDPYKTTKPLGYYLPAYRAAVIGPYNRVCGGCDGAGGPEEVVRLVRLFAPLYHHVLLEGILVSHTFKRYSALATELAAYDYRFLFLDTPLLTCIGRVLRRREERGATKPFDPVHVRSDYKSIWHRVRPKCIAAGHNVTILHWRTALEQLQTLLESAKSERT